MMTRFKSAVELADSLKYEDKLGFKDLKDGGLRNVLLGMAEAYMCVQDDDGDRFESGTGSETLDDILDELRVKTRDEILDKLYEDITATLESFLDTEAEAGE